MGRASAGKRKARETGQTRDHTVPQMYLRQFAEHRSRRHHELTVRRIGNVDEPFPAMPNNVFAVRGYYWGTTPDGVPHHGVEDLFTQLEGAAATVMKTVLDDPDGALTGRWPLDTEERLHLAWWMAAQILRTTRQRKRLAHADREAKRLDVPAEVAAIASNNPHLRYIVEHLASLAFTLFARPWGLAFTSMCLLTSDVPVVLFNAPDAEDQQAAAAACDILLPLDPHRLLFLPSAAMLARDPRKRTDHRLVIPGGVGIALVQVTYDVADAFVAHHPRHDPWRHWQPSGPRHPSPWNGDSHSAPMYSLEYDVLAPHLTVERRWLTEHPPPHTADRPDT
ncbi:DUF4238 domain-containing protein [Streptomyces sp. SAI-127]|uniref:DUF4238 domain-containing protein n=1 Tax=Streptomyces sp. SAI-127 TaxID=2940543 RepID=UPI0024761B40|nr:DUF4238 domain-containing protein [Streptomyces sp. SAI-127]MDH6492646.1 hypothetical protein [Streptomyces sp. SAI-127]